MASWLRALGLRVVVLAALVATVLAASVVVPKPDLPFVLLESFDQAFALAYDEVERQVVALEATDRPARRDVFAMLAELEGRVAAACDTASTALETELVLAPSLSPRRRSAVLDCIDHHLWHAQHALVSTRDPEERAEYQATCERLREVRGRI